MKTEFTGKEEAVLFHLYHSMKGNGFDFGLVDEVRPAGIAAKQAGSVMRALRKKLCIDMGEEKTAVRRQVFSVPSFRHRRFLVELLLKLLKASEGHERGSASRAEVILGDILERVGGIVVIN